MISFEFAGETLIKIFLSRVIHIIKLKEKLNKILSKNTKQPLDKIYNDTERDNFLSAQEAMEYGLIDKVIKEN